MKFEQFLNQRLKKNKYSFTFSELQKFGVPPLSEKEMDRHTKNESIFPLFQDFVLIIPPEKKGFKQIPFRYYIEDLAYFLSENDDYYLGLFTASEYHGASHQRVYVDFLSIKKRPSFVSQEMIDYSYGKPHFEFEQDTYRFEVYVEDTFPPKHEIKPSSKTLAPLSHESFYHVCEKMKIAPLYKTNRKNIWRKEYLKEGYGFNISSPCLTAADLVFEKQKGGMNSILSNIEELSEEMCREDMEELISWYPHQCTLQRLGFLLEWLTEKKHLYQPIKDHLLKDGMPRVQLSGDKSYGFNNYIDRQKNENIKRVAFKWNMNITFVLDSDLQPFDYTSPDKVEFHAY